MLSLKTPVMVSTPFFVFYFLLLSSFFFLTKCIAMSFLVDLEVSDAYIDEFLLGAPEFHLPLAIDHFEKKVP